MNEPLPSRHIACLVLVRSPESRIAHLLVLSGATQEEMRREAEKRAVCGMHPGTRRRWGAIAFGSSAPSICQACNAHDAARMLPRFWANHLQR